MKRGVIACCLVFFCCFAISCQKRKKSEREDKVIAKVGDSAITQRDLIRYYQKIVSPPEAVEGQKTPVPLELKKALLEKLIENRLLLKESLKEGVTVSDKEVDRFYQAVAGDYGKDFPKYLARLGTTPSKWKREIQEDLMIKKVLERHLQEVPKPTAEEISAYYKAHQNEFRIPMRFRVFQIVVPTLQMAEQIRKKLKAGEDFMKLAQRYSISPEGRRGGDLGYWRDDQLPQEFAIVRQMKVGEISDIIHTPYGYHILMLSGVKDAELLPLKEAAPQISERLWNKKREDERARWISVLKEKTRVVVRENILKKTVLN